MANLPTSGIKLSDVINYINPNPALNAPTDKVSLKDCFSAANDAYFDPNYKGNKDRLTNFKNYGNVGWFIYHITHGVDQKLDEPITDFTTFFEPVNSPGGLGIQNGSHVFTDKNFNILAYGAQAMSIDLSDDSDIVQFNYSRYGSLRSFMVDSGYTGSKLGLFYFRVEINRVFKLKYPDVDVLGGLWNWYHFAINVVESLSPTTFNLSNDFHTNKTIQVSADGSFTASTTESWISITDNSGTDYDTITFNVMGNLGVARSGQIKITTANGDIYCTVNQEAIETISVNDNTVQFNNYGNSTPIYVIVTTTPNSGDFTVYSKPSWVSYTKSGDRLYLSANPLSLGTRSGTVVLRHSDNSSVEVSIGVSQTGAPL